MVSVVSYSWKRGIQQILKLIFNLKYTLKWKIARELLESEEWEPLNSRFKLYYSLKGSFSDDILEIVWGNISLGDFKFMVKHSFIHKHGT